MLSKEEIAKIPTRKLLIMLRETYHPSHWWGDNGVSFPLDEPEFYQEDIKEELAKRPHIPNKKEGEEIRRKKSKTRKESRNNRYVR